MRALPAPARHATKGRDALRRRKADSRPRGQQDTTTGSDLSVGIDKSALAAAAPDAMATASTFALSQAAMPDPRSQAIRPAPHSLPRALGRARRWVARTYGAHGSPIHRRRSVPKLVPSRNGCSRSRNRSLEKMSSSSITAQSRGDMAIATLTEELDTS